MPARFFCSVFLFCFSCFFVGGQVVSAACPPFSSLISNGGYGVSDLEGKLLGGCNPDTPYIPASLIKIPTVLAALAILGPDYRFTTELYIDPQRNLYIKGYGDPLLISEEVSLILAQLKQRGVKRINGIYLDTSSFALEQQVPGRESSPNPYDAPVGPVVVNFNSVAVRVGKNRNIASSELQTPTLPIMREVARDYLPGSYRINVCKGSCNPQEQMARYTTELFRALQNKAAIPGTGETGIRDVPAQSRLVYKHAASKDLEYLSSSLLKYSSNFIANLVYLACGAEKYGYPATWAKADRAVREKLVELLGRETVSTIIQEEGAGLSRNNRITVRSMLAVLKAFRPYDYLLGKRMGVPAKSGSMQGIYNYAGYLPDGRGFVIILNQPRNTRKTILARLKKGRYPVNGEVDGRHP